MLVTSRVTCATMTIIVFLLDTSASMNQRTFIGARPTMLDIAKGAVETFVKVSIVSVSSHASPSAPNRPQDPHGLAGQTRGVSTALHH